MPSRSARAAAAAVVLALAGQAARSRAQSPAAALSAVVPGDIDTRGVPTTLPAMQAAFDEFSWRSFVALNWPARANGAPDANRRIGRGGDAPAVWERWPLAEDVFPKPPLVPPPWGAKPHVPAVCGAATRAVFMFTKAPATPNGVVSEFGQALNTGPLVDRNGEYARYAVQLNRDAYDYIVSNKLYDTAVQRAFGAVAFPAGTVSGPRAGAIVVKAAWKVLGAGDEAKRFHRTTAWVYTPAGANVPETCVRKELGLVALHIAHKTASRPQWIWSTFEHVDNAPLDTARRSASFFNPACSGASCAPNVAVPPPWNPTVKGAPTQVTRMTPVPDGTSAVNQRWQAALRAVDATSPWPNYLLVGTQWPTRPQDAEGLGSPAPPILANTMIETFLQTGGLGAASSCMHCHRGATVFGSSKPADYSYLLLRAQPPAR